MNWLRNCFKRRFLRDQSGQSAVVIVVALLVVMGLCAAGVETGHVYYAYRQLVASTQAAALAGAQAMPNIGAQGSGSVSPTNGTAWYNLVKYSSASSQWGMSGLNASNMLQNDTIAATFACGSGSTNPTVLLNVTCQAPISGSCSGSASTCNTLTATQTAQVKLWFGGLVGKPTFTMNAVAAAAMRGGTTTPYNIAVIIDTTNSMTATAPAADGCGSGATQIQCAVSGLKTMLQTMDPCALNTTCSSTTAYVDGVSLFVFPAVAGTPSSGVAGQASDDTVCNTTNPGIVPYAFPNLIATSISNLSPSNANLALPTTSTDPAVGAYEVVSFEDTYKLNDATTTLVTGDPLAVAAGAGTAKSGGTCNGLQAPGGEGTYYAQAIYSAQKTLAAQQASYPGSKNIMIILSDGNATACNEQAYTADGGNSSCSKGSQIVAENCPAVNSSGTCVANTTSTYGGVAINGAATTLNCPTGGCSGHALNGTGTATTNPVWTTTNFANPSGGTLFSGTYSGGYNSPQFPSALGECGQAVQAAQYATLSGTTVYAIAMGSPTVAGSSDCETDQTVTITGLSNGAWTWPTGSSYPKSPCNAIGAMASNVNTFFSDNVVASGSTSGCPATGGNVNYTTIAQIFTAIGSNLTSARLIP
jgi:Flp pilus assembly protein TadG